MIICSYVALYSYVHMFKLSLSLSSIISLHVKNTCTREYVRQRKSIDLQREATKQFKEIFYFSAFRHGSIIHK